MSMRVDLGALLTALCLAAAAAAQEPPVCFVELGAEPPAAVRHEPITVRIRFGLRAELHRDQLVPLFARPFELPVQLTAPWLAGLTGAEVLPAPPADGPTLALGEREARALRLADETRDGVPFAVFAVTWRCLPTAEGPLRLGGPTLRLAYATRFEDDFLQGRVPLDRREASARAADLVVPVSPLPQAGRPADFTGAVGTFAAEASAEPLELGQGERLTLRFRVSGEGNLDHFAPPDFAAQLPQFHVLGVLQGREEAARTFTLDLLPRTADVRAVPALRLPFYAPERGAWLAAVSEPIPLRITGAVAAGGAGGATAAQALQPGVDDIFDRRPVGRAAPALGDRAVLLLLALPWLVAGAVLAFRSVRARAEDPATRRARLAGPRCRAALRQGGDPGAAWTDYLADRFGWTTAAVVDPALAQRLQERGLPADLAERAAAALWALRARRYGGEAAGEAPDGLIGAIEAALAPAEGPR